MSVLPPIGAMVYAVIGTPAILVGPVRVTSVDPNENGVVGPWFTVDDAWEDRGLALRDEGILWTRSADAEAHRALLAAYALQVSA